MALTPFAPLSSLGLDTGRFGFDDFFGGALAPWAGGGLLGTQRGVAGATRPLYTDVVERDKEYEMRVDVPGACAHRQHSALSAAAAVGAGRSARACERASHAACCLRRCRAAPGARSCETLTRRLTRNELGLAGVPKENITLEAEGQVLRLSVRQESEKEEGGDKDTYHRCVPFPSYVIACQH
jgi:HSP20 family molecular chaperone IbpA